MAPFAERQQSARHRRRGLCPGIRRGRQRECHRRALQNLTIPIGQETIAAATQNASLEGNLNSGGALPAGPPFTSQAFSTAAGTAPTGAYAAEHLVTTGAPPVAASKRRRCSYVAGTQGGRDLPSSSFTVKNTSTVSDLENFVNQALGIDTTVVEPGNPTPGTTLTGATLKRHLEASGPVLIV